MRSQLARTNAPVFFDAQFRIIIVKPCQITLKRRLHTFRSPVSEYTVSGEREDRGKPVKLVHGANSSIECGELLLHMDHYQETTFDYRPFLLPCEGVVVELTAGCNSNNTFPLSYLTI